MELTAATSREELVRKYRKLCEKHERLVKRMEKHSLERIAVSRLSRAVLRSQLSATALIEGGSVVATNPAWRLLDTPSEPREWSDADSPSRTFATLAGAALESANFASARNGDVFVRVVDGVRVRLRVERLNESDVLAIAIEDRETGVRMHRVRNHLAAAQFQSQLLLEETKASPETARRAAGRSAGTDSTDHSVTHPRTPSVRRCGRMPDGAL